MRILPWLLGCLALVSPLSGQAQTAGQLSTLPHRGAPPGAPVILVEASDFQCPFCARLAPVLDQIVEAYPTQVTHYYLDFPLDFHKKAFKAHEAAACAERQGQFWAMYDHLFASYRTLEPEAFFSYGREIGMDGYRFEDCVESGRHAHQIKQRIAIGKELGVRGTPAVFINGEMISGARPYADFDEAVRRALGRPPSGGTPIPAEAPPLPAEAPYR